MKDRSAIVVLMFTVSVLFARPGVPVRRDASRRQGPGPWDNDVLVYRVESGGRSTKLGTFERAGVPTLARIKDGRLLAAFQHFPEDDNRNFDRVAVSFSDDEGTNWSRPVPIAIEGLEAGLARPFDPTLVPLPDGRVRLYFTSNRSPDFRRSTPAIYSGVSTDGIRYTFEPGVRFAVEGRVVIDCAVALHAREFHLIVPDNGRGDEFMVAGNPEAGEGPGRPGGTPPRREPPGGNGYHAISKDGLHFERLADVRLSSIRNRWLGNLVSDDGQLVFFGTGPGPWPVTSADGQAWQTGPGPVSVPGADPGVARLRDGAWLLLVTGPPRPGTASALQRRARPDRPPSGVTENPRPNLPKADDFTPAPGAGFGPPPARGGDLPPPGEPFESRFVRIPSSAAGMSGIAASAWIPRRARFTNGAPVVINVAGGVQAGGARGRPEYVGHGFVEIHFAFPGGGFGEERSGGTYDFRGSNCVRALADVIRFATGRIPAKDGRRIAGISDGVLVLTNNVGIVGASHGGNACGVAMARFGQEFPDLAWYTSMESPYGEGAANVELGGHESGVCPAYDPKTGALDLSKLTWSSALSPGLLRKPMPVDTRPLRGAFFFDLNGDGRFEREEDFPANCFVGDAGDGVKAWYSPRILAEAEKRQLIRGDRPSHVPGLREAREFWSWRDAAPGIAAAVGNCTNLAVIVYANERDHVQADPAHTHILEQVEGFRQAGARFVRLNPDEAYVRHVLPPGLRPAREDTFADNPAGKTWTRATITEGLEPSRFPMAIYVRAAVCELADRTETGNWTANLEAILCPDAPGALLPPPGRGRPPKPEGD